MDSHVRTFEDSSPHPLDDLFPPGAGALEVPFLDADLFEIGPQFAQIASLLHGGSLVDKERSVGAPRPFSDSNGGGGLPAPMYPAYHALPPSSHHTVHTVAHTIFTGNGAGEAGQGSPPNRGVRPDPDDVWISGDPILDGHRCEMESEHATVMAPLDEPPAKQGGSPMGKGSAVATARPTGNSNGGGGDPFPMYSGHPVLPSSAQHVVHNAAQSSPMDNGSGGAQRSPSLDHGARPKLEILDGHLCAMDPKHPQMMATLDDPSVTRGGSPTIMGSVAGGIHPSANVNQAPRRDVKISSMEMIEQDLMDLFEGPKPRYEPRDEPRRLPRSNSVTSTSRWWPAEEQHEAVSAES